MEKLRHKWEIHGVGRPVYYFFDNLVDTELADLIVGVSGQSGHDLIQFNLIKLV